jgi:hypothetical protein
MNFKDDSFLINDYFINLIKQKYLSFICVPFIFLIKSLIESKFIFYFLCKIEQPNFMSFLFNYNVKAKFCF